MSGVYTCDIDTVSCVCITNHHIQRTSAKGRIYMSGSRLQFLYELISFNLTKLNI